MSSHLIHTQLFEASFQSKESALAGQKLLQERYQKVLLPIMEQVFDEYDPSGRSLRIDKLELDLGRFSADLPEDLMRDRFRDVLEDQLKKIYLEQGILSPATTNPIGIKDNLTSTAKHSDWEKISYYLVYGRMPWWVLSKEKEPIQSLFNRLTVSNVSVLRSWLKENPISLATAKRLSLLLSQKQLDYLLKDSLQLSFKDTQPVTNLLQVLLSKTSLEKSSIRFWLNTSLLFCVFGKDNELSPILVAGFKSIKSADGNKALDTSQFLFFLSFFIIKISEQASESPMKIASSDFIQQQLKSGIVPPRKGKTVGSTNNFWKKVVENMKEGTTTIAELSTLSKELIHLQRKEKRAIESKSPVLDELEVINNAGLVLVAAFLPRFFENLRLVKAGKFISEQAQIKAVFILQEMLGSEQDYDETDLLLNKLLCGIAPASALGCTPKILASEQKEIALLLESMASQWTALKSNSGKMLSEGFFRREGSLRKVQKGYQLQVQRLPFDMLLDRLPWTIGMIKLPWMEDLIYVEW
ncbi:contractile injection system tape measure protein [Algoriphagus chordae]|uniref:Uncharacterized protein n=1 Tax=Algoriphagus chordae TaxID=237019 RepID=A0A2W7QUU8_9BACT|nr:contractile injection system tape measure protein [Algoriphagus chordae]PZX49870.1 hypothetical protein LV85_02933 [Algoriphagus chordae]